MPFELRDFQDLVQLLRDHPEWREELRALLLTQELLTLPTLVRDLTATVARLAERMDQLTERQDQLTATVARLAEGQQRLEVQMGEVRGWTLEQRYRTHAPAYFGRFLGQVQAVNLGRLADALRERLEEREVAEVLFSDLILTGRLRTPARSSAIWVVLEVSTMVDRADVERAQRRAMLLRQARYPAVAVAAGTEATASARRAASDGEVALLLDGRVDGWQEALDRIMPAGDTGAPS